jgi:uncharacterized protein
MNELHYARGDWFHTYTGRAFYPLDPRAEEICIEDIAHHLSLQCRFNGAVKEHYSIAQHSVLVSQTVPHHLVLWGLLHDAAEAYYGDMVRPLKKSMHQYKELEKRCMHVIATMFGLEWPEPIEVKHADDKVLYTERRDLLLVQRNWSLDGVIIPLEDKITPWTNLGAESAFIKSFQENYFG